MHVLQTLVQTRACLISIGLPSWFKTEIVPHWDLTNCPTYRIENIPNRYDTTVSVFEPNGDVVNSDTPNI